MKKLVLSLTVCFLVMAITLVGCSPYPTQATSLERLRELIAEANIRSGVENPAAEISSQSSQPQPNATAKPAKPEADEYDRPYLGYVPDYYSANLTEAEKRGQQTWYFWTGGSEKFFRDIAKISHGENDFLALIDARPDKALTTGDKPHLQRDERFKKMGTINDPDCRAATKPDEYGLWLDECPKDPHATGIMGARKFPNPNFEPAKWDVAKYYQPGKERAAIEPPYRVGLSCGICHIAFNPTKPPADPEHPKWDNLASAIGNQYIREGALFGGNLSVNDFRRQVLDSQPPGTSDTSRIATDHINNPNAINGIFNLPQRPRHKEVQNDGTTQEVPYILKGGEDSIGVAGASERVYINIGSCSDYWLTLHDPLLGRTEQKPFDIPTARKECDFYNKTEARMADAEAFLSTLKPLRLENTPGGEAYLTKDEKVLEKGKLAFADTCATCHSSKQPPAEIAADPQQAKAWYRQSVLASDFLDGNFLSDDKRYPITEIGTNAARALSTNAKTGHVWAQFSSKTYKELPSPGTLTLENPFNADKPIQFKVPSGGTGYYRTPSLISIWSSAPFLHNNMRGKYTGDPSVKGRMEAFNDAIEQQLWPEKRNKIIKRTSRDTVLEIGNLKADIPKGTPINLLANLDPRKTPEILQKKLNSPVGAAVLQSLVKFVPDDVLTPLLLKSNQAPDFYENHGHNYGTKLSDEDKLALIEFIKTF